jgi:hypothetical protein
MKVVPLRTLERINTRDLLKTVLSVSPDKAIDVNDMRLRIKILDKLEAAPAEAESFNLEDAEQTRLKAIMETFPWNSADRGVLQIIDDVIGAADTAKLKVVEKG